jgi:low affinity Fe/Cu permease
LSEWFAKAATRTSHVMGHYWAFTAALAVCVIWALSGPLFGFSNTWQLVINTGTTVCTFLMVFLIQNTQNRESRAVQLKLDELIRAMDRANNQLIDIEEDTDDQLDQLAASYRQLGGHRQPPA